NRIKVCNEENRGTGVAGQCLFQSEVLSLISKIASLQKFERAALTVVEVAAGLNVVDRVDDQVEVIQVTTRRRRRQDRHQLRGRNRFALEATARAPAQDHLLDGIRAVRRKRSGNSTSNRFGFCPIADLFN